jgi:ABC-2 type transport system permease protein
VIPLTVLFTRSLAGRRRIVALAVLALLPAIAAVLVTSLGVVDDPDRFTARIVERMLLPVILALVTVVLGASVIGEGREDGTILYIAATPLRRSRIIVAAWLASTAVSIGLILPAALVVTIVPGAVGARGVASTVLATVLAAAAYSALAVLFSLSVRHGILAGILYVLLWESSVANFAASASRLSIAAYAKVIAASGFDDAPPLNVPAVSRTSAVLLLVAGTALLIAAGTRRLGRVDL